MSQIYRLAFAIAALAATLCLTGCPASGTDTPGNEPGKAGAPAKSQQSEMERKLNDPSTPEAVKAQIRKGLGK
jgi:hypothetical protein